MKRRRPVGKVLMGNGAMAWGIIEGGATTATSYPGTPASEILETVITIKEEYGGQYPYRMVGERKGGLGQ